MSKTQELEEKRGIVWKARKRWAIGLPWTFTTYALSQDRLFIKRGFLSVSEDEVRLYRIKDLSLKRGVISRIFGLGTIKVCSADASLGDFELKNIKDSEMVKEKLSTLIETERDRKRVSMREFVGHGGHDDYDFDAFDHDVD